MMLLLDSVSVNRVKKLHPRIRIDVMNILTRLAEKKIYIRITDGFRTIEEQEELYQIGRTLNDLKLKKKPVTNAKAGYSWHNYGLAFDFCLLIPDTGVVSWDRTADLNDDNEADWRQVVETATIYGFEWGGKWSEFKGDYPHFQKRFGLEIADALIKFKNGCFDKEGYILI